MKKKFKAKSGGYDALEVDEFLDLLRQEYTALLLKEQHLAKYMEKTEVLTARNVDLEAINLQLKRKVEEAERLLTKGGTSIENLRKIDKYERHLWHLGIDPSKL